MTPLIRPSDRFLIRYAIQLLTLVEISKVSPPIITSEWCEVQEVRGYLKNKCHSGSQLDIYMPTYKCAYSEEYYRIIPPLLAYSNRQIFNMSCSNDTYGYQMCGSKPGHTLATTNWSLCGYLPCSLVTSTLQNSREELCQNTCWNINQVQTDNLKCDETLGDDIDLGPERNPQAGRTDPETSKVKKTCDTICDESNCIDESECNGYFYGSTCRSIDAATGKNVYLKYVPYYEICDGKIDCAQSLTHFDDHKICSTIHPKIPSCISGELYRLNSIKRRIPIFNYTRCAAIDSSSTLDYYIRYTQNMEEVIKTGTPYCLDYIDQTNCTDKARVAVKCHIPGYGISTISKTMVCGKFNRGFCENDMDIACIEVTPSCTVHKHQLCDETWDCVRGADETHPSCRILTQQRCYRNYITNRKLRIPASWLVDGLEDCSNGIDETWDRNCGSGITRRKQVDTTCEDVFLCNYGAHNFIALEELCTGMDGCGNENVMCTIGIGLASTSTAVYTAGNTKNLKYCLKGMQDIIKKLSPCVSQEFNPFAETVYGMTIRTVVNSPDEKTDCNFIYGEAYVILSCMGKCKNSACPLARPINSQDCPFQYASRIYTVVDNRYLTFVTRRANDYHNDYFACANGVCVDYDKVCNLWDDCGDGSDEGVCTNNFKCEENSEIIPLNKKCDGVVDCGDMSDECNKECGKEIINGYGLKISAWIIGLLAVVSNFLVLYDSGRNFGSSKSSEVFANKILVMLIGLGDFLVGIYLFSVAIADSVYESKGYCRSQFHWLTSFYCNFMGVISTFGHQVSLFALTVLSTIRAIGVRRNKLHHQGQNNDISCKSKIKILALISLILISASGIAVVSLFRVFEDFFVNGLVYDQSIRLFHGQIEKAKHFEVIQSYYGRSKKRTLKWKLIKSLVKSMFSKDYNNIDENIRRVDFFGNDGVCLFKYFVTHTDPQWVFTAIALIIDIVCFMVVTGAYIFINISTISSSRSLTKDNGPTADMVNKRNQRLQRKVATIIITDFLCWVPFVVVCFLHYCQVLDASPQYGLFSIILLPINSVLNPFLYSSIVLEKVKPIYRKMLQRIGHVMSKKWSSDQEPGDVEIEGNTIEMKEIQGETITRQGTEESSIVLQNVTIHNEIEDVIQYSDEPAEGDKESRSFKSEGSEAQMSAED